MATEDNPAGLAAGLSAGRRDRTAVALVLLAAQVLYFLPLLWGWHAVFFHQLHPRFTGVAEHRELPPDLHVIQSHDVTGVALDYPDEFYTMARLRRGDVPWWNPDIGCGRPWIGNAQVHPFSPLLLPMLLHPSPWTHTLGFVLGSLVCLIGALLLFRALGAGSLPAAVGAVLVAWNPFTAIALTMSNVWAYWWLPLALWGALLALRDGRVAGWVVLACSLALFALCGQPETAVILAEMAAVFAATLWAAGPPEGRTRRWGLAWAGACAALALLLSSAQWFPILQVLRDAVSYKEHGTPSDLILSPGAFFASPLEHAYLLPVLWALALLAFRRRPSPAAVGLGLVLLFNLAFYVPAIFESLPFRLLRMGGVIPPGHAAELAVAPLTVLAVLGLKGLLDEPPRRSEAMVWAAIFGALALTVVALVAGGREKVLPWMPLLWLAAMLVLLALHVFRGGPFARPAALACLGVLVATYPLAVVRFTYPGFSGAPQPRWESFLGRKAHDGPDPPPRMWAQASPRNGAPFLMPNLNLLEGYPDVRSTLVLNPRGSNLLAAEWTESRAMGRLTRLFYTFSQARPDLLGFLGVDRCVFESGKESPLFAVFHLDPGPRAFAVEEWETLPDDTACLGRFKEMLARDRLHQRAVLLASPGVPAPAPPAAPAVASPRVTWLAYAPECLRLQVDAPGPCLLVVVETFTSRWRARIDGVPAPIFRADVQFRGVPVPAGRHVVEMAYGHRAMSAVSWLCGAAWLAVLTGLWLSRRRSG